MGKYMQWISSLGDSAVSPMNPLKGTKTLNADGSDIDGSSTSMSGYTILKAESMEAVFATAKSCPFLEIRGTLEVSELMDMPGK